jgi:hypothetical protein
MAYPERKPIYDAYKQIVREIIDKSPFPEYAESSIKDLNESLYRTFQEIGSVLLLESKFK